MTIKDMYDAIISKLWIILLVTLISTGIAILINSRVELVYEANSTLYIMTKRESGTQTGQLYFDDIAVNKQLAIDYKGMLKSHKLAEETIAELKLTEMSTASFLNRVNVSLLEDTNIIRITVRDPDPVRASDIANTLVAVFIRSVNPMANYNNISVIDTAVVPTEPVGSGTKKNILLAFAAGMLSSGTVVVLFAQMSKGIKSIEQIENLTGLNVIGILPRMDIK